MASGAGSLTSAARNNLTNAYDDLADMATCGSLQQADPVQDAMDQLSSYYKDKLDEIAFDAMRQKPAQQRDFELLRDFLVDMCAGTFSEKPPSQEDWTQLRDKVKGAAVEHALLSREEKKSVKKPHVVIQTPPRHGKSDLATKLLMSQIEQELRMTGTGASLQGQSADMVIIDDVGLQPDKKYSLKELTS